MKSKILLCTLLLGLTGLLGCSTRVPTVTYHNWLYQKKVQALKHWDLMAKEVVDKTTADPAFAGKTIAVNEGTNATVFMGTMNELMKTELLNRNILSVDAAAAPVTLQVQTQLLQHRGKRYVSNPSSMISAILIDTAHVFTGGAFGSRRETSTELLVITLIKEGGVPKKAVKQIVYVDRDEAEPFYLQPAKSGSDAFASAIKVTSAP